MDQPFIGQITLFAGPFAPKNWAFCNGQLLPINQNQALFSLLGTTYGGNGVQTFGLPDLRGRIALHWGQRPGGASRTWGESGGEVGHTLTVPELPGHTHVAAASSAAGTAASPADAVWAAGAKPAYATSAGAAQLSGAAVSATGGNQPHENRPPELALSYIIAINGIFPSRQ
ncbi:tail fiber protein [Schumannella luteola]|uniref:Microcystin-dependent protein n=1 Tax=Schumannella luteola TaxID=472059 RepID=A0A852YLW5_9MICO|nr:tail fiber protein [Schumannella luteola]NYG98205.1 microcystin-dependent protein [Schumannella luteola]TPX03240.1 phage tail protein [Schumannella luteola]